MTWPNVTINQINLYQGRIADIERTLLFIGAAKTDADTNGELIALNSQSDIDAELRAADVPLLENVRAAQLNGGQNWQAYALIVDAEAQPGNWIDAIREAQELISVEGVVAVRELGTFTGASEIGMYTALRNEIINKYGRWVWFILTAAGLDATTPTTWAQYRADIATFTKDIAAYAVQIVPSLWGNEAGVLAGRLCNRSVTVADSPARVATGPLLGMSADLPLDGDGVELSLATLQALHDLRCSVPMWYPDFEGMYWSDGLTLEAKGGDFPVVEHLRVVDKVARRIRIQAISKIANRNFNTTPASTEAHKTLFGRILREMSRSMQIGGVLFPGEVEPPKEGDVTITWLSKERVSIGIVVRPYASPKEIEVSIVLDNNLEN